MQMAKALTIGKEMRRRDVEGLRGISILMIALFHAFPATVHGGFAAVSVFFTLAGYFAMRSLVRWQVQEKGWCVPYSFLYSRAKRLVSPYWAVLFATLLVSFGLTLPIDFQAFRDALLSALAFISNIFFQRGESYFGPKSFENPYLHTWFLSIQLQLFFIFSLAVGWFRSRKSQRGVVLLLLFLSSVAGITLSALRGKDFAYYSVVARMPEFLLGALAYLVEGAQVERLKARASFCNVISIACVIAIAFTLLFSNAQTVYASAAAFVPGVATAGLLLFGGGVVAHCLRWKPLVYLGRISYELFLVHWPILALLRYRLNVPALAWWQGGVALIGAFGLAAGWSRLRGRVGSMDKSIVHTYVKWGILGALCVLATFSLDVVSRRMSRSEMVLMSHDAFGRSSHAGSAFVGADTLGDRSSSRSILLMGNSHAYTMKRYLDLFGKQYGYKVYAISLGLFPNLPGFREEEFINRRSEKNYKQVIGPTMALVPKVDVILLSATWDAYDWTPNVKLLCDRMRDNQALLVLVQYPTALRNLLRENMGVIKRKKRTSDCAMIKTPLSRSVVKLADEKENVAIVDLWRDADFPDWPFYNDTLMYYDDFHLNFYGSEKYFVASKERLDSALREALGRIVK